jgi:multicomponent Na+:H+ antiporter subunit A
VLLLAVPALALLAALAPLVGRALPRAAGAALAAAVAAIGAALAAQGAGAEAARAWIPDLGVAWAFRQDGLALLFVLLVTGIGALVLLYAWSYLEDEPERPRAMALLLAFMASMLGLVLADDLVLLYVFWEGTSLFSWLLIGFHHDRPSARGAAWQALLVTAAGGLAMLAGVLLLGQAAGTLRISGVVANADLVARSPLLPGAAALVLAGILTKSAQFPLHGWLPRAMEAPTPASAYLHAATMVKAGVYLALRLAPVLAASPIFRWGLLLAGGASFLVGAARAVAESDLKRVLAFTTVSALGFLLLLVGVGSTAAIHAALAYTLAHALYKGALFLAAGAVDHGTGSRDADRLAGLRRAMPFTAVAAGLAAISMAGAPVGFGYAAKEAAYGGLLEARGAPLLLAVAVLGSALLVVAAVVAGAKPFLSRGAPPEHAHEVAGTLFGPPLALAALGLAIGAVPSFADALLRPAAEALVPGPSHALALWHGAGTAALSAATLLLGAALALGRGRVRARLAERAAAWSARDGFAGWLSALDRLAKGHTAVVQTGSLRRYVLVTFAFAVALLAAAFVRAGGMGALRLGAPQWVELLLGALAAGAAIATVRSRSRIGAIAALGGVGYAVGLLFLVFGAPDLAMTQIAVETLTVMVLVLAFRHLPKYARLSPPAAKARDLALAVAVGVAMAVLVLAATSGRMSDPISPWFMQHAVSDAHGRNVVNVTLVDFRGLDTLGEATVLAVAGFGVVALLKLRAGRRDPP